MAEEEEGTNDAAAKFSESIEAVQAAVAEEEEQETEAQLEKESRDVLVDLLLNKGLYYAINAESDVGVRIINMLRQGDTVGFDTYCIGCKRETTFRIQTQKVATRSIGGRYAIHVTPPSIFAARAVCQRGFHVYTYVFTDSDDRLTKIGQTPSVADLSFGELRAIDRSLDKEDRTELGKAIGLSAHDTAIGAFVYLRRVFERMIQRAHERQSEVGNAVKGFETMRMEDRIAALKDELPEKVVENSAVFSVLSVGLHELTEEQCAKHFPVMKAVLFQMLEQEEHKRKAAATARETDAALQKILSDPKA